MLQNKEWLLESPYVIIWQGNINGVVMVSKALSKFSVVMDLQDEELLYSGKIPEFISGKHLYVIFTFHE